MKTTLKVNFGGLFGTTEKQTASDNCFNVIFGGKFKKAAYLESKQN